MLRKSLVMKVVKCNRSSKRMVLVIFSEVASAVAVWKAWKAHSFRWYRLMMFQCEEVLVDPRLLRQC